MNHPAQPQTLFSGACKARDYSCAIDVTNTEPIDIALQLNTCHQDRPQHNAALIASIFETLGRPDDRDQTRQVLVPQKLLTIAIMPLIDVVKAVRCNTGQV
jgi:hypothetical protein